VNNSKTFALIGAAGYVAPRHLRAIKETDGVLKVALDPSDSVGVIDSYFPHARFFSEFERFDRYVDLCRRRNEKIDFVSICSPNYLHDAHVRFALRSHADAICEKPLVLNPWNLDGLEKMEEETGQRTFTILQLRLHPAILALREKVAANGAKVHEVELTYIASRGLWYYASWKGDAQKSGGIATNIGVHFFDMLAFIFGDLRVNNVHHRAMDCASGYLEFERARVRWFLSINARDLPVHLTTSQKSYRSITVDGEKVEFSDVFTDLHIESYRAINAGRGFRVSDVRLSIETVAAIRNNPIVRNEEEQHPLLVKVLNDEGRYLHGWPT
jgi:UDP-N-acetyl-2-amino-2-deoxyglucuronate dehydrogenase